MMPRLSPVEQWDGTVALYLRTEKEPLGERRALGVIARPHKLFVPGDVVVVAREGDRSPVWAESSRGYLVRHYYVRLRGALRIVDPPELRGLSPADPVVRHHVLSALARAERHP
jgi:hypothetical protein